jgi:hypothetical protein
MHRGAGMSAERTPHEIIDLLRIRGAYCDDGGRERCRASGATGGWQCTLTRWSSSTRFAVGCA